MDVLFDAMVISKGNWKQNSGQYARSFFRNSSEILYIYWPPFGKLFLIEVRLLLCINKLATLRNII